MWWVISVLITGVACFYWGYYAKQKEYDTVRANWIDAKKEIERLKVANQILGRSKDDD